MLCVVFSTNNDFNVFGTPVFLEVRRRTDDNTTNDRGHIRQQLIGNALEELYRNFACTGQQMPTSNLSELIIVLADPASPSTYIACSCSEQG